MREINGGARTARAIRPPTVTEFLDQVYLPFYLGKWKESTAGTSENRLRRHIEKELGGHPLQDLTLAPLQRFFGAQCGSRAVVQRRGLSALGPVVTFRDGGL
jgi:hypothetical protein